MADHPGGERRAGGPPGEEPASSPTPPEPAGDPASRAPDSRNHLPQARAGGAPPVRVRELRYVAGDLVVVSGLPGSGKSTLIRRVVPARDAQGRPVRRVDSQDARDRWERRMPPWLAYPAYRPLVRLAHYAGLRRAVRSGDSVVVHDCGTMPWVRRWLARCARRRGVALHLVLLDVPPRLALAGQAARGRGVSPYAFGRHRAAVGRLRAEALAGAPPPGCASAVLLDRAAAGALADIGFD
ncbi:ATP-binding protein [Streptomyces sp. AC536]|uniref:AAA family ATPase n=1 Tax=Streptomyces buecherae TaxID=2763006 RepID=UPI00164CE342|nr:AAA family ATPase [Streptomyces buecherae]MBC3981433.1 ATP-binding protein [Streptomyces buecherae]QNJ44198.1 ATP-binding protein [Streptomyces buecherae]